MSEESPNKTKCTPMHAPVVPVTVTAVTGGNCLVTGGSYQKNVMQVTIFCIGNCGNCSLSKFDQKRNISRQAKVLYDQGHMRREFEQLPKCHIMKKTQYSKLFFAIRGELPASYHNCKHFVKKLNAVKELLTMKGGVTKQLLEQLPPVTKSTIERKLSQNIDKLRLKKSIQYYIFIFETKKKQKKIQYSKGKIYV